MFVRAPFRRWIVERIFSTEISAFPLYLSEIRLFSGYKKKAPHARVVFFAHKKFRPFAKIYIMCGQKDTAAGFWLNSVVLAFPIT